MVARARFVLVRRLARGGMGEVHLAIASGLGGARKLVVVKQVLEGLADDPAFAAMFMNEARLAAGLDHPHIVRVYDVCEIDGRPSLVMEYVHGESLGTLLHLAARSGRRIGLGEGLTIVAAVARALDHAHNARALDGTPLGIVHRDVAPNNILVGYADEVKLIDFGVARAMGATRMTRTGTIKGKAAYMAPEQIAEGTIDARTDVFALGAVLYEVTTMRRAFRADNEVATLHRILHGELVAPRTIDPGYPSALEQVVMTALAIDREQRFASAAAMAEAIVAVARSEGIALGAERLGPLVRGLAGDRPSPTVEGAIGSAVRRRGWRRAWAVGVAFVAGAAVAGLAARSLVPGDDAVRGVAARPVAGGPVCGDGVRAGDEDCDDGDRDDGDGCNRDCRRSGSLVWMQTHQGDDPGVTRDDRGYRVAIDADDGITVVGEAAVADARQNVFVRRIDRDGRTRWTAQPGKAGDDEAWAVQALPDGSVVVGGYVTNVHTGRDLWLAAFAADGRERWQHELDGAALGGDTPWAAGTSDDEVRGLRFVAPDRIVVVGKRSRGDVEDRFAAAGRVDAAGIELVDWRLADDELAGGWDAVADVDELGGAWILAGARTISAPTGAKLRWLAAFTDDGAPRWERALDPFDGLSAEIRRVHVVDDVVLCAGSVGGYQGDGDAWYGAFDPDGRELWSRRWDGPTGKRDFAHAIAVDSAGNLVVVGEAGGDPDRTGAYLDATAQAWIAKLDPELQPLWSELYNGPENTRDVAFDVAIDATDHIVVVGYQSVAGNGFDLWVRKHAP